MDKQGLKQLVRDLNKKSDFSINGVSGEDAIRKMIYDTMGVEEGTRGAELYRAFSENKNRVFEIIDVMVDESLPVLVGNEFDSLANYHSVAMGDQPRFRNANTQLFRVARIASGTQDLRRQNALGSQYTVETDWYGAKVYAEFEQFLLGQVDWAEYINNVARSFTHFIGTRIFDAISNSYDGVRASHTQSGSFDLDKLVDLAQRVKASAGASEVTVYGTESALYNIAKEAQLSDSMLDEMHSTGLVGQVRGMKLVALPAVYKAGTEEFLIGDDVLLIVPTGEKIVDVVLEGETFTKEDDAFDHNALQMEFVSMRKLGVGVRQASTYGFYKIGAGSAGA